jgi:hypothetical protein
VELAKETAGTGHENWKNMEKPGWLLYILKIGKSNRNLVLTNELLW